MIHCGTEEQLADIMTKPLKLGVCDELNWEFVNTISLGEALLG